MRTKKHSSKAPITMLFLSLIILITIFIFYYRNKHDSTAADDSLSMSVDNTIETSSVDPDYIKSADNEYSIKNSDDNSYPDSYELSIPYVSQYPQLPTGCEITSLTEVLHYLGYYIDKEELARNYLAMKDNSLLSISWVLRGLQRGAGALRLLLLMLQMHFLRQIILSIQLIL